MASSHRRHSIRAPGGGALARALDLAAERAVLTFDYAKAGLSNDTSNTSASPLDGFYVHGESSSTWAYLPHVRSGGASLDPVRHTTSAYELAE